MMKYSSQVKPISFLKANAAEVFLQPAERREPLVITQNGEPKAVMQDVASYEATQELLALLIILALGNREIESGSTKPVADVVARLRSKRIADGRRDMQSSLAQQLVRLRSAVAGVTRNRGRWANVERRERRVGTEKLCARSA
jgi:prevent-host-death family protein